MPKFRDPQTGEIYDTDASDCNRSGFCEKYECPECPVYTETRDDSCVKWVNANPHEAAKLMGYELLDRPCRKPLKDWTIKECKEYCNSYHEEYGRSCAEQDCLLYKSRICMRWGHDWMLCNFTNTEVEIAKILHQDGITELEYEEDGQEICAIKESDARSRYWYLPPSLFPSMKPGWHFSIAEIIGEGET